MKPQFIRFYQCSFNNENIYLCLFINSNWGRVSSSWNFFRVNIWFLSFFPPPGSEFCVWEVLPSLSVLWNQLVLIFSKVNWRWWHVFIVKNNVPRRTQGISVFVLSSAGENSTVIEWRSALLSSAARTQRKRETRVSWNQNLVIIFRILSVLWILVWKLKCVFIW